MKATERHHLKQNEFAETTARVATTLTDNRSSIFVVAGAIVLLAAVAGGWTYWRRQAANQAGSLLGVAVATAQAQIAPAPTLPGATQQANTFPTDQARAEAALKAFQAVSAAHANTDAGRQADFQAAAQLLTLNRVGEAEAVYKKLVDAGGSSLFQTMARMGLAEAQSLGGKFDDAVKTLSDLAAARDENVPADAVLMQLARVQLKAGKTQDARAAFKRVVDEYQDSTFADDARQQLAALN